MLPVETSYGSDKDGLIWAFAFQPGQAARAVDADGIADLLTTDIEGDWFLWIHVAVSNAASEPWLRRHLALPEEFYELIHEGARSTRLEQSDESLLAVIHDVLFDFAFDAAQVSTMSLCVQPRVLVSARIKPLRSIDRLRSTVKAGAKFRSSAELLGTMLGAQANVLVEIVRHTTARVDEIEDKLLANRVSASRTELGSLRRMLVRLQRLLAPEPAALFRLLSRPPFWVAEDDLQDLRQAAEEFSAVVADSVTLVERVKLLQEELVAQVNEQTNRTLFLLTVVTVLALPFNVIAGLFGMNVGGIPFATHGHGFVVIVAIVALVTGLAGWFVYRRAR